VNALLNLELDDRDIQSSLFPKSEPNVVTERLIQLLDLGTNSYADTELEQTVTPLVALIRRFHETAPPNVRQDMRNKLLPTDEDRKTVLGSNETLSSRLLRNSINPTAPELREAISHLLFDMSDKDVSEFVKNVGYGFASGFLFQNNLPIPESVAQAFGAGGTEDGKKAVNPITGQFLDSEKYPQMAEMTEEEKMREAERLFVLFER
jgi:hypothetical protein